MKIAVLRFPAANCDLDALHVLRDVIHMNAELVWHRDFKESRFDAAVLPGGFSYGDHLRGGVISAFSPALKEVKRMAKDGRPVLGICNGFQTLTEAGLLPGALLRNQSLKFVCKWVQLKVTTIRTSFTRKFVRGDVFQVPIAHGEGNYFIPPEQLKELEDNEQIVFKYSDFKGNETPESNPNGSFDNIAGVCSPEGNVVGLMPHPERASERILNPFNNEKARLVFESMKEVLVR
ncbi:phosphoribosylformylglycinamidine synthase I [Candidatus Micrarchaeota archaeon]|nr:phosphoribosylformylglycinamidine synthase I [Candidatus Micrarchaeota archaeon]